MTHPALKHRALSVCLLSVVLAATACTPEALTTLSALGDKPASGTLADRPARRAADPSKRSLQLSAKSLTQTESLERMAPAEAIVLSGKIQLPRLHERNLYGRKMLGSSVHAHLMDSSASAAHAGHHNHRQHTPAYRVIAPESVALDRYLSVRAVPLMPPADADGGSELLRRDHQGGLMQLQADQYEGSVDAQGNFTITVPPYAYGYMIAVDGGKLHLKARLPGAVTASRQDLVVDPASSLIADASLALPTDQRQLSNQALAARLGDLAPQLAAFQRGLQTRSAFDASRRLGRQLLQGAGFRTLQSFAGCTGGSPELSCYDASTDLPYNLMSASEISTYSASSYSVGFASAPAANLSNQYTNGTTGVLFSGVVKPWLPRSTVVEQSGFALVTPPGPNGGTLRMTFESDLVKSVGLTIQNGSAHSAPGSTIARRGFRLIARDRGGNVIQAYHWYTNQDSSGLGFYGLTVPAGSEIGSLEIQVRGSNPFTVGNLIYSEDYLADSIVADGAGNGLRENLGWRATGSFTRSTEAANTFYHHFFGNLGSGNLRSGTPESYSRESFWQVAYGGASESTLVAPAFTLSNLPLLQTKDQDTDKWNIGVQIDATKGYTDTVVSKMRIPNNTDPYCSSGMGCRLITSPIATTLNASGAAASDLNTLILPPGAGANYRADDPIRVSDPSYASAVIRIVRSVSVDSLELYQDLPGTVSASTTLEVLTYAQALQESDFSYHEATGPMHRHWSHVHWQSYLGVEDAAQFENVSGSTERYVEYSTDNGRTWRNAWWFRDENHHGRNGVWWNNHMHPYPDSDLNETDTDGDGSLATRFEKSFASSYASTVDNNHDDRIDSNDHAREWDTEFYMEYRPLDPLATGDVHVFNSAVQVITSDIEGASIVYRFRFVGPSAPAACTASGVAISCDGWKIDDVAFNNDDPEVGYYTSFDGAYDSNLF